MTMKGNHEPVEQQTPQDRQGPRPSAPLVVLSDPVLLPVTVGLSSWQAQSAVASAGEPVWNLVAVVSLVSILPLIVAFVALQRFWRGGLSLGSIK